MRGEQYVTVPTICIQAAQQPCCCAQWCRPMFSKRRRHGTDGQTGVMRKRPHKGGLNNELLYPLGFRNESVEDLEYADDLPPL